MSELRKELPPLIDRFKDLPLERGYPVPWFVGQVDGHYDFRVIRPDGVTDALRYQICWLCGQSLGPWVTFVVGPMCAVNRNTAEPPCHRECAEWAAIACPFLSRPHMVRNEANLPPDAQTPEGIMLRRNPGVALCWHTTRARFKVRDGFRSLIDMGKPLDVSWFAEGRPATREEILASIESGLPKLREFAELQGPQALRRLEKQKRIAMKLVPA